MTVYLLDVNDRSKINPVRKEFFSAACPASTLIGGRDPAIPDKNHGVYILRHTPKD